MLYLGQVNNSKPTFYHKNEIIKLLDIRKEYSLSLAKLNLSDRYLEYELKSGLPDPEEALILYTKAGNFEAALSLGKLFGETKVDEDAEPLDLTIVFASLAVRCVELTEAQLRSKKTSSDLEKDFLGSADLPLEWGGNDAASKSWLLLKKFLEIDDQSNTRDRRRNRGLYRKIVIEKALERNKFIGLPPWLTDFYQVIS